MNRFEQVVITLAALFILAVGAVSLGILVEIAREEGWGKALKCLGAVLALVVIIPLCLAFPPLGWIGLGVLVMWIQKAEGI